MMHFKTSLVLSVFALSACSAPAPSDDSSGDGDDAGPSTGGSVDVGAGGLTSLSGGSGGAHASGGNGSVTTGGASSSGGAAATGGSEGGELCTPGGEGYSQATGYVIANATCVHYQVFDLIPESLPFQDASAACEALALGGFDDWRLPSVEELSAIVVKGAQPSVDATIFPNTANSMYWTSMTSGGKVTCLDFYNEGSQNNAIGPDGPQAYRCVR